MCGAVAGATMVLGSLFGRFDMSEPRPEKCLNLTRELNDYITNKSTSVICPEIISEFEFSTPERKDHCAELLFHVLDCFALIMERELDIVITQS